MITGPYKAKAAATTPSRVRPVMPTLRLLSADEDEVDVEDEELPVPDAVEDPEVPDAEEESEEPEESEVPVADAAESVAVEPEVPVAWAGVPVEVK